MSVLKSFVFFSTIFFSTAALSYEIVCAPRDRESIGPCYTQEREGYKVKQLNCSMIEAAAFFSGKYANCENEDGRYLVNISGLGLSGGGGYSDGEGFGANFTCEVQDDDSIEGTYIGGQFIMTPPHPAMWDAPIALGGGRFYSTSGAYCDFSKIGYGVQLDVSLATLSVRKIEDAQPASSLGQ